MSETEEGSALKAGHPPAVKVAGGMRVVQHKEKHDTKKDANQPEDTTNPLGDPNPEKNVVAAADFTKVDKNKTPSALKVGHEKPQPAVQAKHNPQQRGVFDSVPRAVAGEMAPKQRTSVKDVDQADMTRQIAVFLKKSSKVKVPEWADLCKLAKHKELAPTDPDWYFTRTAAIARRLYIRSPSGVGALQKVFGGRMSRGTAPSHFGKASRAPLRKALQTLEAIKWVTKGPDDKGRVLTQQGRKDLDRIASQLRQANAAAAAAAAAAQALE